MKKKVLSLLLVISMIAMMLMGCGGSEEDRGDDEGERLDFRQSHLRALERLKQDGGAAEGGQRTLDDLRQQRCREDGQDHFRFRRRYRGSRRLHGGQSEVSVFQGSGLCDLL